MGPIVCHGQAQEGAELSHPPPPHELGHSRGMLHCPRPFLFGHRKPPSLRLPDPPTEARMEDSVPVGGGHSAAISLVLRLTCWQGHPRETELDLGTCGTFPRLTHVSKNRALGAWISKRPISLPVSRGKPGGAPVSGSPSFCLVSSCCCFWGGRGGYRVTGALTAQLPLVSGRRDPGPLTALGRL